MCVFFLVNQHKVLIWPDFIYHLVDMGTVRDDLHKAEKVGNLPQAMWRQPVLTYYLEHVA